MAIQCFCGSWDHEPSRHPTPEEGLAQALHAFHLGCRLDYRGDWDCADASYHREKARQVMAYINIIAEGDDNG